MIRDHSLRRPRRLTTRDLWSVRRRIAAAHDRRGADLARYYLGSLREIRCLAREAVHDLAVSLEVMDAIGMTALRARHR